MAPEDLFRRISSLMEHTGIAYMLTGSFASSVYGMNRSSADIDFVIAADEAAIRRILNQLPEKDFYSELNQALEACQRNSMFNVIDHVTGLKIDFIFLKSRNFSQEEFRRRKQAIVWGAPLYIATPEDIVSPSLSGQNSVNHRGKSKMQQGSSKFVRTNSTFLTSKSGSPNSDSLLSGFAPARQPTSNKNPTTRYTYRFIHPFRRDPMASSAVSYAREHQQKFLGELKDLLRIPSVSTAPEHKEDVRRAAMFVADEMRRIGLENVDVIPTKNHPLVYGDWLHARGKPTVLCYAHYDVQPPDPLNEWLTPPFEPTERNQNIYARGAVDDKGQLWMEIKAVEALMRGNNGKLPINVKFIIEGEEEVGGESIAAYVRAQKAKLKADFALVCDTELFAPNLPTLCVGLRGLVYTEIEAVGAKTDLHSGMYGGAAPNPFFALIEIISKLKDSKGKILIPGFYKGMKAPSKDELKTWKRLPFNEEHYRKTEVGSKVLTGEPGYSVLYRTWARPTLEVHGMPGGFTAPGAKTVIPARAFAKVSMRLVPNQDPDDVLKKYTKFVRKLTPKGIETNIKVFSKGPACVVGTNNRFIKAATEALRDVFKKDTVFIRSGGSIPIVTDFQDVLKIPSVMMGFGLPDDNLHAPNEKFHIPNFYRGIESIIRFFEKLEG